MSAVRIVALAVTLLVVGGAALDYRADREMARRTEQSLIRIDALAGPGMRSMATAAGISTFHAEVQPLRARTIRRFDGDADFHAFRHRCTSCHVTPDPSQHAASDWPAVVDRMSGWMIKAGLLEIEAEESASIVRFLVRAAPHVSTPAGPQENL